MKWFKKEKQIKELVDDSFINYKKYIEKEYKYVDDKLCRIQYDESTNIARIYLDLGYIKIYFSGYKDDDLQVNDKYQVYTNINLTKYASEKLQKEKSNIYVDIDIKTLEEFKQMYNPLGKRKLVIKRRHGKPYHSFVKYKKLNEGDVILEDGIDLSIIIDGEFEELEWYELNDIIEQRYLQSSREYKINGILPDVIRNARLNELLKKV